MEMKKRIRVCRRPDHNGDLRMHFASADIQGGVEYVRADIFDAAVEALRDVVRDGGWTDADAFSIGEDCLNGVKAAIAKADT